MQVLNKSGVLLIVATWESFIESLVLTSANFLAAQIKEPHQIPKTPKSAISNRLKADKHNDSVWLLAGEGWKSQLQSHAKEKMSRLNTPSSENVDALFSSTLGFDRLSSHWYWPGCANSNVIRRLESLLELRHEIAHGVRASRSVTKKYVRDSNTFVIRLAAISSNRLSRHLFLTTGKLPWTIFIKGAAR